MEIVTRRGFGSSLARFFDRIYCINLDRRPDRWDYVLEHLKTLGLNTKVQRFKGIDLRDRPDLAEFELLQRENFSLLGNCGCILSHRKIIETAELEGLTSVLVLEDDVEFLYENLHGIRATLKELGQLDWRVFYLGASYVRPFRRVSNHLVNVHQGANATHAIAYHRSVFKEILRLIPADPIELVKKNGDNINAIDIWLRSANLDHGKFYGSNPIMAVQGLQDSDIAKKQQENIRKIQMELFEKNLRRG